jgi:hypothetical protein
MQSQEHKAWFDRWSKEMASDSAPGGRVDRGPAETLGSRAGRAAPRRQKGGGRVPPPSSGQTSKR